MIIYISLDENSTESRMVDRAILNGYSTKDVFILGCHEAMAQIDMGKEQEDD